MSAPTQEQMSSIHGNSKYVLSADQPQGAGVLQFMDFAPAPCSCCACLAPKLQKGRQYAHIYDNRLSINMPFAPCCCLTCDEKCIVDKAAILYHDRPPARAGMCCFVIPCTCCGPPVIFVSKPVCCCCIDMVPYFGEQIKTAPCNFFGLKKGCCCGGPCYMSCAAPMFMGVKNGAVFLDAWKTALDQYGQKTGIKPSQRAIFEVVKDSEFDHNSAQTIGKSGTDTE